MDAGLQDIEEVDHLQLEDLLSNIMEEEEPLVDELEGMGSAGYEPTSPAKSPQQEPSPPTAPQLPPSGSTLVGKLGGRYSFEGEGEGLLEM